MHPELAGFFLPIEGLVVARCDVLAASLFLEDFIVSGTRSRREEV